MSIVWFIGMSLVWSGVLACLAQALTRGVRPVLAQAIWRGAALLTVLPWLVSALSIFWPAADLPIPDLPLIEDAMGSALLRAETFEATAREASGLAFDPGRAVIYILLAGWAVRLAMMALSQARLQRLKANAIRTSIKASHWASRLCLARTPDVHFIMGGSPFIAGVRRPVIYLPQALGAGSETDMVIAHECVHLKRGDLIYRPFERLIADIFWFSPFAWIIRGRLDYWREAVVDEQTAKLTGDRIAYARALTQAARLGQSRWAALPVSTFTLPGKNTLKARLNCLLDTRKPDYSRRMGLVAAALTLLAIPVAVAQGNVVHKSELAAANFSHAVLDEGKLTSIYGERTNPFTKKIAWHNGIDIAAPMEAPIYAPADGKVIFSGERAGYGRMVDLKLMGGMKLRFGQMDSIHVTENQSVHAGDVIGTVGMSGRSTGPHLHLEVWKPTRDEAAAQMLVSHAVLDEGKLTSIYGERTNPFTKKLSWHNGIDIAAPMEAPIYAPADGKVIFSGERAGYGRMVDLKLMGGMKLRFGQMDSIHVTENQSVHAGDVIGTVGTSGRATGPHLHLEVWKPTRDEATAQMEMKTQDPASIAGLQLVARQASSISWERAAHSHPHEPHKDKDKECKTEKPERPERPARPERPERPR